MTLGEQIKLKRKEKGLTVRELAKRSNMSHAYLSQIENNKVDSSTVSVRVIDSIYDVLLDRKGQNHIESFLSKNNICFNNKTLNDEQKQKILTMLDVILN